MGILAGQTHLNWDATIAREGAGRTPFLSAKGREGARRRPFFVHGGARRGAENGNGNTFCPRRAAEGHGEHLLVHGGAPFCPRRGAPTDSGSLTWVCPNLMQCPATKNTLTPFCPRRARRGKGAGRTPFLSAKGRRGAKGREEDLFLSTEGRGGHLRPFLSTEGRGGARRTS